MTPLSPPTETASPANERAVESAWKTGVSPLIFGSGFFLLGTKDLLRRFFPQTSLAQNGLSWLAIVIAAAVLVAGGIWTRRHVNAQAVSPRESSSFASRNWLLLPIVLVPTVLVSLVLVYAFTSYGHLPTSYQLDDDRLVMPGFAVMCAAISFYYGRKHKSALLWAYGAYLLGLALLIWWLPASPIERSGWLMSGTGGPLAVFGATRLKVR